MIFPFVTEEEEGGGFAITPLKSMGPDLWAGFGPPFPRGIRASGRILRACGHTYVWSRGAAHILYKVSPIGLPLRPGESRGYPYGEDESISLPT